MKGVLCCYVLVDTTQDFIPFVGNLESLLLVI